MSAIKDQFNRFLKRYPIYNSLLSMLIGGLLLNLLSDYLPSLLGLSNLMRIISCSAFIIIVVMGLHFYQSIRKVYESQIFEPLGEQYKGLIVSVSKISEPKKELKDKIDSVKDLNDTEKLNELYEIRGIGQTLRAIRHHLGKLEVCWLLYTKESEEANEVLKHFIKKFDRIAPKPILIEKPFDMKSVHKTINEIYVKGIEEVNLHEKEVIADITGGTTPMSGAIIIACHASSDRAIEYVEQNTNKLIKIEHT